MSRIEILDCTLRDGGYVNEWNFGESAIKAINTSLDAAGIDIVECGFLMEGVHNDNCSLFNSIEMVQRVIPKTRHKSMYVAMIATGKNEIDPSKISPNNGEAIDGIRLSFHIHEIEKALDWGEKIKEKGYKLFMQPVGTISYSDIELLKLVDRINKLNPYALYIVDTLGSMSKNEILHKFYILDSNLNGKIKIGFHGHNNLQLAFSNAQKLCGVQTKRNLILDSSIYGMGRAAGNLPTELITEYINNNINYKYDVTVILDIYEKYIERIRERHKWGYEIPYQIAASNNCHPNYGIFLINKQTLTMRDIKNIINLIPREKKAIFDKNLIEQYYLDYQNKAIDDSKTLESLESLWADKDVLILAPGNMINIEYKKIMKFIDKNKPYIVSVNFIDQRFPINCCFISNLKRADHIKAKLEKFPEMQVIVTSNITISREKKCIYVDYYSCLNGDDVVFDNAGLLLLKLLIRCKKSKVTIAGFDGFKTEGEENNYYDKELEIYCKEENLREKDKHMKAQLKKMNNVIDIKYLTQSTYEGEEHV